jgi:hypothetical protein
LALSWYDPLGIQKYANQEVEALYCIGLPVGLIAPDLVHPGHRLMDQAGPAIWLYLSGHLVWHGEAVRSEPGRRVVPVVTPTSARLGPRELKQA